MPYYEASIALKIMMYWWYLTGSLWIESIRHIWEIAADCHRARRPQGFLFRLRPSPARPGQRPQQLASGQGGLISASLDEGCEGDQAKGRGQENLIWANQDVLT